MEVVEEKAASQRENEVSLECEGRKHFQWSAELITAFNHEFGEFVSRSEPNPMPARSRMEAFVAKHRLPVKFKVIRNRINNERKKVDERKFKNKTSLFEKS